MYRPSTAPKYLGELREKMKLNNVAAKKKRQQNNAVQKKIKQRRQQRKVADWFARLPDE